MNSTQRSVIVGSLLGDAHLVRNKKHPNWNWAFAKKQCKLDNEGVDKISFINYHVKTFSPFIGGNIYRYTIKPKKIGQNVNITPETRGYIYQTRTSPFFTALGEKWYRIPVQGKMIKVVPYDLKLDPISLCIWFMDDGCKEKGKIAAGSVRMDSQR